MASPPLFRWTDRLVGAAIVPLQSPQALLTLTALLVLRLLLHAPFQPAFEGPDEVFHLARVRLVAIRGVSAAVAHAPLQPDLIAAVRASPCSPDLQRTLGCPAFADVGRSATWNLLHPPSVGSLGVAATLIRNYEDQQPPAYYYVAGMLLRFLGLTHAEPPVQLLAARFFSAALVCAGLAVLSLMCAPPAARLMGLTLLLLPGATEALVRASNDALAFLWASVACLALMRGSRTAVLAALCFLGPLIKLTCLAIVAVVAVRLMLDRTRPQGLLSFAVGLGGPLLSSSLGWSRPSTYRFDGWSDVLLHGPFAMLSGFARSAYGMTKSAAWLGGWAGFRPRGPALVATLACIAILVLGLRMVARSRAGVWHGAGLAVALAGFVAIAAGNRVVFGEWGGIAGWYLWNWAPWLWWAAIELADEDGPWPGGAVLAEAAAVTVTNVFWWDAAARAYGPG